MGETFELNELSETGCFLTSPEERSIFERIKSDFELKKIFEGLSRKSLNLGTFQSPDEAKTQDGFVRERSLGDYEGQIGLDVYDYLKKSKGKNRFHFLDAGCGEGLAAEQAALFCRLSNLPVQVNAIDIRFPSHQVYKKVNFGLKGILEIAETARYDLITASFVLPHLTDPLRAIERLYNSLAPRGMLAATVFPDSLKIDGVGLFEEESPLVRAIKDSGGELKIVRLEGHPNKASALHLRRGDNTIAMGSFESQFVKPKRGFPIEVTYKSFIGN